MEKKRRGIPSLKSWVRHCGTEHCPSERRGRGLGDTRFVAGNERAHACQSQSGREDAHGWMDGNRRKDAQEIKSSVAVYFGGQLVKMELCIRRDTM